MSNKNLKLSPSNSQAVADIYSNLINGFTQFRKVKTRSINEADATGAIYRKLCKATEDERHEIVTEFIINKIYPILETRNLDWSQDFFFIQTTFKNHLINKYKHANTKQQRFEKSIISMGCELDKAITAYDNQNITAHEAELTEEEILMSTTAAFHAFVKTLSERDRAIIEATLLLGKTSKEAAKIFGLHEVTIRNKRVEIMTAFRATLKNGGV
jgi:hypothetical protein